MKLEKILEKLKVPKLVLEAGLALALLGGCSVDYVQLAQKEFKSSSDSSDYIKIKEYCLKALQASDDDDENAAMIHLLWGRCNLEGPPQILRSADSLFQDKRFFLDWAKREFEDVLNRKTDKQIMAKAYLYRGQAQAGLGDVEKAITDYNLALAFDFDDLKLDLHFQRGIAKARLGLFEEAIKDFETCYTLVDKKPAGDEIKNKINVYHYTVLIALGRLDEAKSIMPYVPSYHMNYHAMCISESIHALLNMNKGEFDQVTDSLKRIIEILSSESINLHPSDQYPAILDIIKKGAEKASADEAGRSIGSIEDLKKYRQDLVKYADAVRQNSRDFSAYYCKAVAEQQLQLYEEAADDFDTVLKLKPDYLDAEKRLRECRERAK